MSLLRDLTTILIFFSVLTFSYLGWGWAVSRLFSIKFSGLEKLFSLIWLGWVVTLLLLQVLNLFVPITASWSILLIVIGLILAPVFFRSNIQDTHVFLKSYTWVALTGITAVAIALLSMQASTAYDSGLYHFNSIRWLNERPIVLGLGNLHSRLAFNQSFFAFAAFLNLYPIFNHGQNIANGFLLFLLSAECLSILLRQAKTDIQASNTFMIFVIPVIIYLGLYTNISSPAPDTATYILQILIFTYFIHAIADSPTYNNDDSRMIFVFILSATAITVKLSSLVFVITISLLLLISKLKHWRLPPKQAIINISKMLVLPAIIMMIWGLRGILTSGCPVYPSTLGCIKASWSVPTELVKNVANVIYSWARLPREAPEKVLSSWNWLEPWFHTEILGNKSLFVYPLITAGLCLILCVFASIRGSHLKTMNKYLFLLPLPILMGLVFWFFTAPSVRFAQALVLMLPIVSVVILTSVLERSGKLGIGVLIALFLVVNLNIAWAVWERPQPLTEISIRSFRAVKTVRLIKRTTLSGLEVFSPKKDDQCWDSELPCTPEFREELEFDDNIIFPEFRLVLRE